MSHLGDYDSAKVRSQVEMERRIRAGAWSAGVKPHVDYQKRPLDWIVKYLEVPENRLRWSMNPGYEDKNHKWDGDVDPLVTILETLASGRDCGVESATGVGKTYLGACITLWFLACFEDSIIPTVAPKEDQLLKHIWKEIGDLWPKFQKSFPTAELLPGSGVLRMKPLEGGREKWAAYAFVCGVGASEDVATKAQGEHAVHMLHITEETPGIDPAIMAAIEQTRTDDHNLHLAFGNPDHQYDPLHHFCQKASVVDVRISALDHPNVVSGKPIVPGTIGRRRLAERTKELGVGSRLYQSRIRGFSPPEAEDALIKYDWCLEAAERFKSEPSFRIGVQGLGVDAADSPDGDNAAIARWLGDSLPDVGVFRVEDANLLGKMVADEMQEERIDPRYVGLDTVGIGAGTKNELKRLGIKVRFINGAAKAIPGLDVDSFWSQVETELGGVMKPAGPKVIEAERFDNLRSQVYWRMREDLRVGNVAIRYDKELFDELCAHTWEPKNGKICVLKKDEVKKLLKHSPNRSDACVYGNWVRRRTPVQAREGGTTEKTSPNLDRGFERMMARRLKQEDAKRRHFKKRLKRMNRRRR